MAYEKLVKEILKDVGGKENINGLTHCITRLRFNLKDEEKANTEELKEVPGVVTVVQSGGQYQVVIGDHVRDVYKEFIELSGLSTETEVVKEKKGLLDSFIDIISGIFTPVLGLLAATGMIKGLNVLFVSLGWFTNTSGTYAILQAAGDCFFYFFPIFLGYTAAKKFGLNQFVGMALGAALVYPAIAGLTASVEPLYTLFSGTIFESPIYITFLGIPVILMNYGSSVIPIVVSTFFGSKLEKSLARIIPGILKSFLVPFLTVIIMVPLTFIIIGPIATWAGDLLGEFVLTIYNFSPIVAGIAVGAIWQVLVMFGLHWGIIPIAINNISVLGYDPVMVLGQATPFATAGAVLAVIIKSRNVSVRAIGIPAFISSLFGVSEPSLYGVTLPRKKPFIATLISASVGGLIMGIFGTKSFIMGGMGIFSLPNYISPESGIGSGFYGYVIAIVVAFVLSFILTLTFLYDPKEDREAQNRRDNEKNKVESKKNDLMTEVAVSLPIAGEVFPLSEIADAAFSTELLGKGLAVRPSEGKVYAPFDGTVETFFPTNHAVGLKSVDGIELLIHIGMDTVNLEGKYFVPKVKQEDTIKKGQLLLEFDGKAIQEAGYSIDTPIVVTNTKKYLDVVEKVAEKELIIIK
ncbi:beta-glucoside-specific PTS transporter subunit IIABC [Enterococcus lactis]|uniref:beta-glucoside-specific PTS transporter subunit IIABC n=1 Tax=Enterococcus TaxID=1350 RepID=UPI00189998D8|nr:MULTISPECIES: beta-glucoside-specific PTS transporter subunit IIABC [Enterococcus]MBX4183007.1 beta-glucoside-specific PTS transporter subunit IIABC [Enterococcus lactis]MBX4185194.1 beta-glucoside-specific PTS transporter subunit IIABC [Enterococcus lactis]MBX4243472.1 beta-glucoside-specific PTS transporter subunit IIABC [Enterococcus lactis]MDB7711376.1 beta-glucoside-specific PTS transporter subunit IIABC [Enterococcus faecium]MDQ8550593.1 beta-glucoside-specific PTS transporter subunit